MAAGNVSEQGAVCGGRGRQARCFAEPLRGGKPAGQKADRGRFDVALTTGDLTGEAQTRQGFEPQRLVEQLWRIKERVAVQAAEPRELGIGETRNGAKNT